MPIKLYSTGKSASRIRFNWINRDTGARVKLQYVDAGTGDPVPKESLIKGYEFAKNQFVLFEKDELDALQAQGDGTIRIVEFVPRSSVDRVYVDRSYHLGPEKGASRAYQLLSVALRRTGRVAIAKYSARGKMYVVLLAPQGDGLVMEQLRYEDQVHRFEDVPWDAAEVSDAEVDLAVQLIEQSSREDFDASGYKDEVHERILRLIERKVDGQEISTAPVEQPEAKIIDLMEALRKSLGENAA